MKFTPRLVVFGPTQQWGAACSWVQGEVWLALAQPWGRAQHRVTLPCSSAPKPISSTPGEFS